MTTVLTDRFWAKVRDDHGCWTWTGAVGNTGYGQWAVNGTAKSTHRLAWADLRGPIPDGLQIDHLCRNKACVNPWHMELVTAAVNIRRRFTNPNDCLLPPGSVTPWNRPETVQERRDRERAARFRAEMTDYWAGFFARLKTA